MEGINKKRRDPLVYKRIKKKLFGSQYTDGLFVKVVMYVLIIAISFVYIYPMLYMLSNSLKSPEDIINPMVNWVPSSFYILNFVKAIKVLNYFKTLGYSLLVTLIPAFIQTAVTSVIGYGFARFNFRFKKFWLIIVLISFIVPSQVYIIPRYVLFYEFSIIENPLAIILPALFGQGEKSSIFILIFYQFFKMIPKPLTEAAEIDGAGPYYIFFKIAIPLSWGAYITAFLFSLVWYWNETYISSLFLGAEYPNLQLRLASFVSEYQQMYSEDLIKINEGVRLSATLLIILPMLIVYFIMQRWFVEGVERTGITGE